MARQRIRAATQRPSAYEPVLETLAAHGLAASGEAIRMIANEDMRLKGRHPLGAPPHERSEAGSARNPYRPGR